MFLISLQPGLTVLTMHTSSPGATITGPGGHSKKHWHWERGGHASKPRHFSKTKHSNGNKTRETAAKERNKTRSVRSLLTLKIVCVARHHLKIPVKYLLLCSWP